MAKIISRLSIRTKILSSSIIMLLLICAFIITYYPYADKKEIDLAMQKESHSMAKLVAVGVGVGMQSSNFEIISEALKWSKQDPDLVYIAALDEKQEVFGSYSPSDIKLSIQYLLENDDMVEYNGRPLHIAKVSITYEQVGYGTIILVTSLEEYYQRIEEKSVTALLVSVVIFLVGMFLSFFFSRTITKPLINLQHAAEKIAKGDYDIAIEVHSQNEIGVLGQSFQKMAEKTKLLISQLEDEIKVSKRAEEAVRQSQKNYENLVGSIDGIVWEADVQTFQFTFVSQQAERLLGYPIERWLTEPTFWKDHIHPDDQEWAVALCIAATREKRAHDFEYRAVATDGHIVWLRDIVSVIVENDLPVKLRGVMVDITTRKLIEQEREQLIAELKEALANIKTLKGLLPICASCKKVRDDHGYWQQVEGYVMQRTDASFSHGICPDCMKKLYPDFYERLMDKHKK